MLLSVKNFQVRIQVRPALFSMAIGGAIIGVAYLWFRFRSRSADETVVPIDDTIMDLQHMRYEYPKHLTSNRSAASVVSRTSNSSEKRSLHQYSTLKGNSSSRVAIDSDVDETSSFSADYRRLGLRTLADVVEHLDSLMSKIRTTEEKCKVPPSSESEKLINDLRQLLENAYSLLEQYKRNVVLHDNDIKLGSLESLTSQEDTSSYFSACEHLDLSELELLMQCNFHRILYYNSLKLLDNGEILCKDLRTQFVGCELDIEYLGKMHCLRQGFDFILEQREATEWMISIGKLCVFRLLHCLNYPLTDFEEAFERLMKFVLAQRKKDNSIMWEELMAKGIKVANFYDVVLDYMLLEAFELLANPPSSVLSVTRHRWLSDNFKRCALDSTVWTILMAKRKMLKHPDGFFAHYYSVIGTILPALAWGFLGPNESHFQLCDRFREEIISFVRESFVCHDTPTNFSRKHSTVEDSTLHLINTHSELMDNTFVDHSVSHDLCDSTVSDLSSELSAQTIADTGSTLLPKTTNGHLDEDEFSTHHQVGLRYTSLNDLAHDLYRLIGVYSNSLLNIFTIHSNLLDNPLPEGLQTDPPQPNLLNVQL